MHRSRSWLPSKMAALWTNLAVATWLFLLLAQTPSAFADICTFDDGLCDWETGNCSATACFKTFKAADSPRGPAYDHTNSTDQGSCAYSVPSTSKFAFRTSEIWRDVKGPFCFTAWYHQSGPLHEDAAFSFGDNKFLGTEFYRTQREMAGRWQRVRYSEHRAIEGRIKIRHAPLNPLTKGVFVVDDLAIEKGECPADSVDGSCDFDLNSTCGYDLGEKEGGWQLQAGARTKFFWSDFSTNTRPGGILFLETGKKDFTAASFVSPELSARPKVQCLRFYYYISRSFTATKTGYGLKVTATGDSGKVQTLWYRTSDILVRGLWSAADMAFKVEEGFKVKFEVALLQNATDRPSCAIDAIEIRDCSGKREPSDRLCDFEDGWCSWRNLDRWPYALAWTMGGGSVKTTLTKPPKDHTFGANKTGSYIFLSNFERRKGDKADLVGEILPAHDKITQCVEFWYIINGGKDTSLKVRALKSTLDLASQKPLPLWTQEGDSSITWKLGRIAAPHSSRVVFTGTVGAGAPEYVALDDIDIISEDLCETMPASSEALEIADLLSCPFDRTHYCHWTAESLTAWPWMYGPSFTSTLGPRSPPQGVKGRMMYVTGRVLAQNKRNVALVSPTIGNQADAVCVSVWYHMFGGRDARLRMSVFISDISAGATWKRSTIFRQDGRTTSDRWYNVRRTVMLDGPHNKLKIEASNERLLMQRNQSIIALGPLEVTSGECDVLTDGRGYCDFELDECGWTPANGWTRKMLLAPPLPDMGPRSGPVNSAYFLQATESSSGPDGATLTSPEWSGESEPQCLEFWYQSWPAKPGDSQLQVEVLANGKKQPVWKQSLFPSAYWMLARVQIVQENKFKVVFRAKIPGRLPTALNLDNVVLRQRPCDHPASCNFVDGICGYVNQHQGPLRWLVGNGRLESPSLQPKFPVGQGVPPTFAYLDLTTGKAENDLRPPSEKQKTVGLASPLFDVSDDNTKLNLFYLRNGPDIKSARLVSSCYGEKESSKETGRQELELPSVTVWSSVSMTLRQGTNCQLTVVVTRGDGSNGTMAVGPIQVTRPQQTGPPESSKESSTWCTFEDGTMCGWSSGNSGLKWALNEPSKEIPAYPRSDHTLQAYRGRFIFVTSAKAKGRGFADLNSPEMDLNGTRTACLSFWRFGIHENNIRTSVKLGNRQFYAPSSRANHRWNHVLVGLDKLDAKFKLTISVALARGLVALDDIEVTAGRCPERDLCTLEPGSPCRIVSGADSFSRWKIHRGVNVGIPDHTLRDLNGSYLYLNTTAVDSHHPVARLFLYPRPPTQGTCVTFWWRGRGARSQINVYRYTSETLLKDPLVSVVSNKNGDWWIARTVTITSRNTWRLAFEVVAATDAKEESAVLLDDIEFTDGKCPPYEYCTFEDECLPWQVLSDGSQEIFSVERAGSFEKLAKDHTTGTKDGYYMLYKNTGTKGNVSALTLREPLRYKCASLWYYLPKLSGGVELYIQNARIIEGTGVWKRYQMLSPPRGRAPIVAISGTNPDGFVAIDDVLISEKNCDDSIRPTLMFNCGSDQQAVSVERVCDFVPDCKNGADEQNCGQCEFRKDTCGWNLNHILNRGNAAWRRTKIGSNPRAPQVGADGKRDGYYLLLSTNTTIFQQGAAGAVVDSPRIRNTNKLCTLSFWYNYNQKGQAMDVNLYMKVGGFIMPVWTLSAHSRKPREGVWNAAFVDIGRYRTAVMFYFKSNSVSLGGATFAVDHIDYDGCALPAKTGNCSSNFEFQCANGACSPSYARCDYVDDCGDNSDEEDCEDHRLGCNFDTSFCEWVPEAPPTPEASRWTRRMGVPFLAQLPSRDHTTGTPEGKFIAFTANQMKGKATIQGPKFSHSTLCAISFFHTVHGKSDPQLTLNVRTTRNGPWKTIWKQSRPTQFWHFESAFVQFTENAPFQVAFIGEHRVSGMPGYIAIDDVTFFESCKVHYDALPEAPSTPAPPSSTCDEQEFQCGGSTQCIPKAQVCDFRSDCSNGADEARCGACDFTDDLCGLTNSQPDARFGWNLTRAQDVRLNVNFPETDSRQSAEGAYAAYSLLNPGVPATRFNSMVTPPLGPIAHSCIVSFYAYMHNRGRLTFGVLPQSTNGVAQTNGVPLAALGGSSLKGTWRKISVATGNWDAGVRFFYQGDAVGTSVDQIEYSNCHPDTQAEGSEASLKVSCDFSSPKACGWFPERKASDLNWLLFPGGDGELRLRWQPQDSVSHSGAYMYALNLFVIKKIAHLVSIKMSPTPEGGRCFTFWYNMWHPNSGVLNVLQRVSNVSMSVLWSRSGSQGKAWQQGQVQVNSDDPYQLVFEAVLTPAVPAVIAIDNFKLKDGQCESGKGCTFETGSCGWQLHNWELTKGSSVTLPQVDHSAQAPSGTFALAKAPGGRMVSAPGWYDASKHKCLRFWYFIAGADVEALNVTRLAQKGQQADSIWSGTKTDAPMARWYSASAGLTSSPETNMVVFEGVTSGDPDTAVAVDDITLSEAACPAPGSCSFEEDMCNWFNNNGQGYPRWYRNRGRTSSPFVKLSVDHTKGTPDGYYLMLDSEDFYAAKIGSLQSQRLNLGPAICFKLYYYRLKEASVSLNVTFVDALGKPVGKVGKMDDNAPSGWTELSVEQTDLPDQFWVVISALTSYSGGIIAIDDIVVSPGTCDGAPGVPTTAPAPETPVPTQSPTSADTDEPSPEETSAPVTEQPSTVSQAAEITDKPTTATPPPSPRTPKPPMRCSLGYFNCRDGVTCISSLLLCDGVRDCPNGLDEKCGSTNVCKEDEFFCASRSPSSCLPRSLLCDGKEDCDGGSDETLCRACPHNLCLNDGLCTWTPQEPSPICDCSSGYEGRRCESLTTGSAESLKQDAKGGSVAGPVVAGVLVTLALVIAGAVVAVVVIRKRRLAAQNTPLYLNNPSYDASSQEARIS